MNRVFVYGTLKSGQRNAHYMHGARYLGRHVTARRYSMFEFGGYPAVCERGGHAISGEVYLVDERRFRRIDDLEWYPHFYQRIEIPTNWGQAWMYVVRLGLCRDKKQLPGSWP